MNDFSINLENRDEYVYGIDDVKQCWDIILKTIPGSIPFMPEFGSNVYQYLDKPINVVFSDAVNTIIKDLERWETRAKVNKVSKEIIESNLIIKIYGTYTSTGESIIAKIPLTDVIVPENEGIGYWIIENNFIIQ